jgi:iron complex transport system ATP-binding protein
MLELNALQIGHQKALNTEPLQASFGLGQLVVLLGRNGCGKTTLLRTLGRWLAPQAGQILWQDKPLASYSATAFAKTLSIVTTERLQTPYLTVYNLLALGRQPYLGFWGKLHAKDHAVIASILDNLGIMHLRDKYLTDCSDGEQQLVLLGRALAQDTAIILLDEATAHLDFVNRIKIFQTLQQLAIEQQKLLFLATHELEIALKFAHQVILFESQAWKVATPAALLEQKALQRVFKTEGLNYQLNL